MNDNPKETVKMNAAAQKVIELAEKSLTTTRHELRPIAQRGDFGDQSSEESAFSLSLHRSNLIRNKDARIKYLIKTLRDPNFDGYCTACGGSLPLKRVIATLSTLCVKCAEKSI